MSSSVAGSQPMLSSKKSSLRFIVKEYNLLWAALKLYEQHLLKESVVAGDEDARFMADEKLVTLEAMFKEVQTSAWQRWDLELKK